MTLQRMPSYNGRCCMWKCYFVGNIRKLKNERVGETVVKIWVVCRLPGAQTSEASVQESAEGDPVNETNVNGGRISPKVSLTISELSGPKVQGRCLLLGDGGGCATRQSPLRHMA